MFFFFFKKRVEVSRSESTCFKFCLQTQTRSEISKLFSPSSLWCFLFSLQSSIICLVSLSLCRGVNERVVSSVPDDAAGEPTERERTGAHSLQQPHPTNAQRGGSPSHSGHHRYAPHRDMQDVMSSNRPNKQVVCV